MSGLPEFHAPTLLRHHPQDLHVIGGHEYRWAATTETGYLFSRVNDPDITEGFTFEVFDRVRRERSYRFHRGWFDPDRIKVRLRTGTTYIADLSNTVQATILFRMTVCSKILQRISEGLTSLSDASLKACLPDIEKEVEHLDNPLRRTKNGKLRKARGGGERTVRRVVGPKAVRVWLARLRDGAYDPIALAPRYGNCGSRAPVIDPDVRLLAIKYTTQFATRDRPPRKQLYDDMEGELKKLNTLRAQAGLERLTMPSVRWFNKQIRDLDAYHVVEGRYGPAAAKAKFRIVSGGLDVTRPYERLEMDEWEVSLMVLAIEAGVWESLTPEQRDKVARMKCHLCVAICCATRCIVGISLAPTASSDNALAALRMALVDKGRFADLIGILTPWDMCGTPESVVTDGGPSFANRRFRLAVLMIGAHPELTVGGIPWLRGRVERVFRTIHTRLVARFAGRTFENVSQRGDYESEANANLFDTDLRWSLCRYLVDIYHNTPHEGLAGRTPREEWLARTALFKVKQPPDRDTLRAAFGIERTRVLDHEGVRFLGLQYQSERLQAYRRKAAGPTGTVPVAVRIDHGDIGTVSVALGEKGPYLPVDCVTPGLDDVSVATWMPTLASIRARFTNRDEATLQVVQQTVREIETLREATEAFAGISPASPSDAEIQHAEDSLGFGFCLPAAPTTGGIAAAVPDDLLDGAIDVGPAAPAATVTPEPDPEEPDVPAIPFYRIEP
jgi:putative transposase